MEVGILDQDALLRPYNFRINLEVMKLASYYRKNNHGTSLILDARKVGSYDKIFVRKNKFDNSFPHLLLRDPRVEYGGYAFTNQIYHPLPEEIENTKGSPLIYEEYLNSNRMFGKAALKNFKRDQNSSYLRLSTNGVDLVSNYMRFVDFGTDRILIFDKDVPNIPDSFDFLSEINQRFVLDFTENLIFSCPEQLKKWLNLKMIGSQFYSLEKEVSDREYLELLEEFKGKLSNICFLFGRSLLEHDLIYEIKVAIRRVIYNKLTNNLVKIQPHPQATPTNFSILTELIGSWSRYPYIDRSLYDHIDHMSSPRVRDRVYNILSDRPDLMALIKTDIGKVKRKGGVFKL